MSIAAAGSLEEVIGYNFKDKTLLNCALTHRSMGSEHNERFEFMGDSILSVVISEHLFHRFEHASEGQLTRLRARLVKKETLSEIAAKFNMEAHILLGPGEKRSGGAQRSSIQADAVEALMAAILLDSDMATTKQMVLEWFSEHLNDLTLKDERKDPKTTLQEWLQSRKLPLPVYEVVSCEGPAHSQNFEISCQVEEYPDQKGQGLSRRAGEQDAAQKMLEIIRGSR